MTTVTISDKQQGILNAIKQVEEATVKNVAKFLGVTAPAVQGSMVSLKKNGFLTINEGVIALTEAGIEALGARTAEQNVAEATVAKIETPSIPKALQVEGQGPVTSPKTRTTGPRTDSKASKAQAIFDEFKNEKRAVLMQKMMDEVGLTRNGANTYIYNMRKAAGMVVPRGTVAAPETEVAAVTTETTEDSAIVEQEPIVAETPEAEVQPEAIEQQPETTNEQQPEDNGAATE